MAQPGVVLDVYDDHDLSVLNGALEGAPVPEIIKTAHPIGHEDLDQLADDDFALVMVSGAQKIRKFACVDPGHTTLSCIYFHENRDKLDNETQKHAAIRLAQKCDGFGLPSDSMWKVAQELEAASAEPTVSEKLAEPYVVPNPTPSVRQRTVDEGDFLLNGRFPVTYPDQVKEAQTYFLEQGKRMAPSDRHDFCVELVKKAAVHGVDVDPTIARYGNTEYGAEVDMHLQKRKDFVEPEFYGLIDKLAQAMTVTPPGELAEAIREFDEQTGLNHLWDQHVADPYWTTFGVPIDKVAEFVDNPGAEHVTGSDLSNLASTGKGHVEKQFSAEMAEEFAKDPIAVYGALPDPHKKIMARLASDHSSDGGIKGGIHT
jgi:hypothetical protein